MRSGEPGIEDLCTRITGRGESLFRADLEAREAELRGRVAGKRALVVGGAGTIGSAAAVELLLRRPAALHVVDANENGLAELVRDLRSRGLDLDACDFRADPLDYGSPVMQRFLDGQPPYDLALNFAALKHVRSEKDLLSVLQMLDTNVVKAARFFRWIAARGAPCRLFSVSTDKAADPVNLMGATKRAMEHVLFSGEAFPRGSTLTGSARFANVAFSAGSLLEGFLYRLRKRQPLAVPRGARRYFLSPAESGHLCLLAAILGADRQTWVPRLDPARDAAELRTVAAEVLAAHGLEARFTDRESDARGSVAADLSNGRYPVLLTELDTTGEKGVEVFAGKGERAAEVGMKALLGIDYLPAPAGSVRAFLARCEEAVASSGRPLSKRDVVEWLSDVLPGFSHLETGKHLDQRM